eukprot:scaffold13137_cov57-Cyclotella_meneghiniana.AAC.7
MEEGEGASCEWGRRAWPWGVRMPRANDDLIGYKTGPAVKALNWREALVCFEFEWMASVIVPSFYNGTFLSIKNSLGYRQQSAVSRMDTRQKSAVTCGGEYDFRECS